MTVTAGNSKNRLHHVAVSANGKEVYADLMLMPLAANVGRNPHLLSLIEEAIGAVNLTASIIKLEHDMGRNIGYSETVATADNDSIFYARQTKAGSFTRFVKNRRTDSTQYITISLVRDADGNYELQNVWIGRAFPALPGEIDEAKNSRTYWADHAVVYNGQPIIAATLTKDCPY